MAWRMEDSGNGKNHKEKIELLPGRSGRPPRLIRGVGGFSFSPDLKGHSLRPPWGSHK